MELWKDIKDYEGMYQVSNLGRIKSLDDDLAWTFEEAKKAALLLIDELKHRELLDEHERD